MSDTTSQRPLDQGIEMVVPPVGAGATLTIPAGARGLVLFAHGSGSSRFSPRNRFVASGLHAAGFGTLLFDLLTRAEEEHRGNVFDIALLAQRLVTATEWLAKRPERGSLPMGYFGASTGAASALVASTLTAIPIGAIVSRGGRPDLAGPALPLVTAPTLMIVGGNDLPVISLNRDAAGRLRCPHEVSIVPGATHLFDEPGTLEAVIDLARDWFARHL
jgi:pimeloyl-ACP methyl ester carboxylesterase